MNVDDLCLSELFEERWQQARRRLNDPEEMLRKTMAVEPSTTEFGSDGDGVRLTSDAQFMEWPSRAALVADALTAAVVREEEWFTDRPIEDRIEILGRLRIFIDTCPECAGEVSLDMETVESCCSEYDVYAARCQGCGARLVEVRV